MNRKIRAGDIFSSRKEPQIFTILFVDWKEISCGGTPSSYFYMHDSKRGLRIHPLEFLYDLQCWSSLGWELL